MSRRQHRERRQPALHMIHVLRWMTLGAALTVLAAACAGTATSPTPQPSDLASAPLQVTLGGRVLSLEASLWRDFMPISPPDGKPLIAAARVKSDNGSPVPATIVAETLWVLNGNETWSATPREERPRSDTAPVYEVVARDGPKWSPGAMVDVVVRLRDGDGRTALLRVARQPIQATY